MREAQRLTYLKNINTKHHMSEQTFWMQFNTRIANMIRPEIVPPPHAPYAETGVVETKKTEAATGQTYEQLSGADASFQASPISPDWVHSFYLTFLVLFAGWVGG